MSSEQPDCVICSLPVEPWPGGGGWGNNPAPYPSKPGDRACTWCNQHVVIPLRLGFKPEGVTSMT